MSEGIKSALLIDIDSTIPNLALMHISSWKKQEGYRVGWNISEPDEIYASVIFDWNRHKTDGLKWLHPNAIINIGGSGYSLSSSLPDYVNRLMPDYSIYPNCDYDLGFTTRGCIRKCPFCIVPKKEGLFHKFQHPRDFHLNGHKKSVLLDNNILADKDWFIEVCDYYISQKIAVDFTQGLDIRLVDKEIAEKLTEVKTFKPFKFAFDSCNYESEFKRGVEILQNAGLNLRSNANIYVYLNDDTEIDSAIHRCNVIRDLQAGTPFIMVNKHAKRTQNIINLCRWARPWIFWSTPYDEYRKSFKGHA